MAFTKRAAKNLKLNRFFANPLKDCLNTIEILKDSTEDIVNDQKSCNHDSCKDEGLSRSLGKYTRKKTAICEAAGENWASRLGGTCTREARVRDVLEHGH